MNIEGELYVNHHFLLIIALYPTQRTENFYIAVISNNQSFISQILSYQSLGKKFDVLTPLGSDTQRYSCLETSKIKLH